MFLVPESYFLIHRSPAALLSSKSLSLQSLLCLHRNNGNLYTKGSKSTENTRELLIVPVSMGTTHIPHVHGPETLEYANEFLN